MHELSIAMSLVEEAKQIAIREKATRIVSITVSIGRLSGIELEPLEFAFPLAAEGTPLENTQLNILHVPAKVLCEDCKIESSPGELSMFCPNCKSHRTSIIQGRDILITSMEIEYDV